MAPRVVTHIDETAGVPERWTTDCEAAWAPPGHRQPRQAAPAPQVARHPRGAGAAAVASGRRRRGVLPDEIVVAPPPGSPRGQRPVQSRVRYKQVAPAGNLQRAVRQAAASPVTATPATYHRRADLDVHRPATTGQILSILGVAVVGLLAFFAAMKMNADYGLAMDRGLADPGPDGTAAAFVGALFFGLAALAALQKEELRTNVGVVCLVGVAICIGIGAF